MRRGVCGGKKFLGCRDGWQVNTRMRVMFTFL